MPRNDPHQARGGFPRRHRVLTVLAALVSVGMVVLTTTGVQPDPVGGGPRPRPLPAMVLEVLAWVGSVAGVVATLVAGVVLIVPTCRTTPAHKGLLEVCVGVMEFGSVSAIANCVV